MTRSNKMPPDFAKRVSAGLKTMHARKKAAAQARLNRAAVAWCLAWDEHGWARLPDEKLAKAVRAFQKINASQTKGNK